MKKEILLFLSVSAAVALFLAFRLSGLEEIKVISAAVSLYHLRHFVSVVCGLVNRFMEVQA